MMIPEVTRTDPLLAYKTDELSSVTQAALDVRNDDFGLEAGEEDCRMTNRVKIRVCPSSYICSKLTSQCQTHHPVTLRVLVSRRLDCDH